LTKFLNIDLQKDSVLSVKLERVKKVETISKNRKLIWSGKGGQYQEKVWSAKNFKEAIKLALTKGEFETTSEFESRIEKEKNEIFNSWLGTQNISMQYNPDREVFSVEEKSFGFKFGLSVPRSEAREFKKAVKNFDFIFEERGKNLYIIGAKSGNFSTNLNINLTKQRREIKENSVVVGNLMFQDKNLPQRMDWDSAVSYCEDLNLIGFSDWRLPNRKELKIAQNNKNRFRNLQSKSSWYWSISKYNSSKSWMFPFDDGNDYWGNQTSSKFAVCVRDL
jgi:hypothetical protein